MNLIARPCTESHPSASRIKCTFTPACTRSASAWAKASDFAFLKEEILKRDRMLSQTDTAQHCRENLIAVFFRDLVFFAPLARNRRPPPFRDLVRDFFTGCRLSAPFETAVARLAAFRTGRPSAGALPTTAPITPPTTAPTGPAMLPITAPVTAPAVCFGMGGTWISSDDWGFFFFSEFG
jgi:hypothetical protein